MKTQLVVTLHGIRTFGHWQERLEKVLRQANDEQGSGDRLLTIRNYKFGYFSVIAFAIPVLRWIVVWRFRKELHRLASSQPWDRIDLVGHSFGTHVLSWALLGMKPHERPSIHTIILAGSVLRADFPWQKLIGTDVRRVVNDCGSRDNVLLLSQFLVLFTGMAGRTGFIGTTHVNFRNRYSEFGHSGYFIDDNGHEYDRYMAAFWAPALLSAAEVPHFDQRRSGGILDGIAITLANNAEPIKLTVYVMPFILAVLWIAGLYATSEDRQRRALSEALSAEAQLLLVQQPFAINESAALAVAANRFQDSTNTRQALRRALDLLPALETVLKTEIYDPHVALSRSTRRLALTGPVDGKGATEVWDLDKAERLLHLSHGEYFLSQKVAISEDGKTVAIVLDRAGAHRVVIKSMATPDSISAVELDDYSEDILITSDGEYVIATAGNKVHVIGTTDGATFAATHAFPSVVAAIALASDQRSLALVTGSRLVVLRDWSRSEPTVVTRQDVPMDTDRLLFSHDNKTLFASPTWGTARRFAIARLGDDALKGSVATTSTLTGAVAFSPNDRFVMVGYDNGRVEKFDLRTQLPTGWVVAHDGVIDMVTGIAVGDDDHFVATVSADRTARVWRDEEEVARLSHRGQSVDYVAFLDSGRLVTVGRDNLIKVWRVPRRFSDAFLGEQRSHRLLVAGGNEPCVATESHQQAADERRYRVSVLCAPKWEVRWHYDLEAPVSAAGLAEHGSDLHIVSGGDVLLFANWMRGDNENPVTLLTGEHARLASILPDSRLVARVKGQRDVEVVSYATVPEEPDASFRAAALIRKISLSSGGRFLVVSSEDGHCVYIVTRSECVTRIRERYVGSVADISDKESMLANIRLNTDVESWQNPTREIEVLNLPGGEQLNRRSVGRFGPTALTFSPTGLTLAAGMSDRLILLLSVPELVEVDRIPAREEVTSVAFSPDGSRLYADAGGMFALVTKPEIMRSQVCDRLLFEMPDAFNSNFISVPVTSRLPAAPALICAPSEETFGDVLWRLWHRLSAFVRSYVQELVTAMLGGVFDSLRPVPERHSVDDAH